MTTDQLNPTKQLPPLSGRTIYDASFSEIMFKNFLAGLFSGLGHVAVYLIGIFIAYLVFLQVVWPQIQPLLDSYQKTIESLQKAQEAVVNTPKNLQDKFEELLPFK